MKTPSIRRTAFAGVLVLFAGLVFLAGRASANQPHMTAALDHLRAARTELEAATADKGGHRNKALNLVKDAIVQVEKGIQFDRHN